MLQTWVTYDKLTRVCPIHIGKHLPIALSDCFKIGKQLPTGEIPNMGENITNMKKRRRIDCVTFQFAGN